MASLPYGVLAVHAAHPHRRHPRSLTTVAPNPFPAAVTATPHGRGAPPRSAMPAGACSAAHGVRSHGSTLPLATALPLSPGIREHTATYQERLQRTSAPSPTLLSPLSSSPSLSTVRCGNAANEAACAAKDRPLQIWPTCPATTGRLGAAGVAFRLSRGKLSEDTLGRARKTRRSQSDCPSGCAAAAAAGDVGSGVTLTTDSMTKDAAKDASELSVEELLRRAREATGIQHLPKDCTVQVKGQQELMALHGTWEFAFDVESGAFAEAYVGSELSTVCGFDGRDTAWEVDAAGRVSTLDLDDYEASCLMSWLRSGVWTLEKVREQFLDIRPLHALDCLFLEENVEDKELGVTDEYRLAVSFKGGKVVLYVAVREADFLPVAAVLRAYGKADVLRINRWHEEMVSAAEGTAPSTDNEDERAGAAHWNSLPYRTPADTVFTRHGGDVVVCATEAVMVCRRGNSVDGSPAAAAAPSIFPREQLFHCPASKWVKGPLEGAQKAELDPSALATLEVVETRTGHLLVKPLINGKDWGYFILDTGASALTIEPAVANDVGLRSYGCVRAITVNGPAACAHRRGDSFNLGPLTIHNPRFVDVGGAGLAHGTLPVVGICGFDVFWQARVWVHRGSLRSKGTLRLEDPESPLVLAAEEDITWLPLRMLANVPHVSIKLRHTADDEQQEALLLLDTGAAGAELIFNGSGTKALELLKEGRVNGGGRMRGMGSDSDGDGDGVQVAETIVAEVELAEGVVLKKVRAIVMAANQNSLELSAYTYGLACQNLFSRFDLVFEYARHRVGLVSRKKRPPPGKAIRSRAGG